MTQSCLDRLLVSVPVHLKVFQFEPLRPVPLMQIHKHSLLELSLAVCDCDGVVMSIKAVNKGLDTGLVNVANVRGGLSRLLPQDNGVRVDETEGINDNFPFDGLDRVDDYGHGAGRKGFEGLVGTSQCVEHRGSPSRKHTC